MPGSKSGILQVGALHFFEPANDNMIEAVLNPVVRELQKKIDSNLLRKSVSVIFQTIRRIRGFQCLTRIVLFFEFTSAIKEIQPKDFLGKNVRGLLEHDDGKTLVTIKAAIADLGYTLIEPRILKAIFYRVPQKRERLFLVGIRNDLVKFAKFNWSSPHKRMMVLRDALKAGKLYPNDVPKSFGQTYPEKKKAVLDLVPPKGYWRDLPDAVQREYMKKSYFFGGGKTGVARRLSYGEPSLTLPCALAQNQTEQLLLFRPSQSQPHV